jgi:hypothetical protein
MLRRLAQLNENQSCSFWRKTDRLASRTLNCRTVSTHRQTDSFGAVNRRSQLLTHIARHNRDSTCPLFKGLKSHLNVPTINISDALDCVGNAFRRHISPFTRASGCLRGGVEISCLQIAICFTQKYPRGIGDVSTSVERDDRAQRDDLNGRSVARFLTLLAARD